MTSAVQYNAAWCLVFTTLLVLVLFSTLAMCAYHVRSSWSWKRKRRQRVRHYDFGCRLDLADGSAEADRQMRNHFCSPYNSACVQPTVKEEMKEKENFYTHIEPACLQIDSQNSIRNKEEQWIIPVEELDAEMINSNITITQF